ncbi:MATE family efflux transporter [Ruminococcus bovis]|uniref:Probable multidrug resistance protein NorM n=1 Tax=Ruminococcus bovis TaxID=2564099 RepID=A0A4V1G5B9_9FIRM|nr:MATE family efflux transporter [Ruminococcus bovis]QCT07683.1 MATE family efflux transporter [Ruminococcus bovis]
MFTNKDLRNMIIPIFFEQFLLMLVGLADTFVVSYAGEDAVSGVSLVNSFNTILLFLFTALASGGAVIICQYIGCKDKENSTKSACQLLMFSTVFSVVLSVLILIFSHSILVLLFGKVEQSVMNACVTYLKISVYSFPALAIYNAGAALCRSIGKSNVTMNVSIFANFINILGNCIGVYVLKMGVAGVAYPSLISRTISAIAVTVYCFKKNNMVSYKWKYIFSWNSSILKKVMKVAVPNGVENGVHQLVKVAISSIIALFGTCQIAANGVAQSIWSLAALMGLALSPVYTTVIGRCMGANDIKSANFYFKKLNKLTTILSIVWNGFVIAITPILLQFFTLSAEAKHLVIIMVIINNAINGLVFTYAGPLGNGLRAAGDVKFTMIISVSLTVFARLFFSIILGITLNLGVIGVTIGMCIDLIIRAVIFLCRYKSQKWTKFKLI